MKKALLGLGAVLLSLAPISQANAQYYVDDAKVAEWAKPYVDLITEAGCMVGYPDGTFKPTQDITRQELAVVLVTCLDQVATYAIDADDAIKADLEATKVELQVAANTLFAEIAALDVRTTELEAFKAEELKERNNSIGIGMGLATEDMGQSVVSIDGKIQVIELTDKLAVSVRPGFNSAYEGYLGASLDYDATQKLELYAGGGVAMRFTDANVGVLTNGKEDLQAVGYVGGGAQYKLSPRTGIYLDVKHSLAGEKDTVVTTGVNFSF